MQNYAKFFSLKHSANLEALWTSVYISVISVITCAIVGVTMAFLLERYEFPGRQMLTVLAMVPMALPPLIGVLSFTFFIQRKRNYSPHIEAVVRSGAGSFFVKRFLGRYYGSYVHDVHVFLHDRLHGD